MKRSVRKSCGKKHSYRKKSGGKRSRSGRRVIRRRKSRKSVKKSPKRTVKRSFRRKSRRSHKKLRRSRKKSGGMTKKQAKNIVNERKKEQNRARRLTGNKKLRCPAGEIERAPYIRKNGTVVGPACIKNRGEKGNWREENPNKTGIVLEKGALGKFGYHNVNKMSNEERHKALMKAVDATSFTETIRRLVAVANLTSRNNPRISKIFKNDQEWLSKKYNEEKKNNS